MGGSVAGREVLTDFGGKLVEGVWPSVRGRSGDRAESGPTGKPWVDSNGWKIRLLRDRQPQAATWLSYEPPADRVLSARDYLLAIADAEAFGARWVVALDPQLAAGIASGSAGMLQTWRQMNSALRFFHSRAAWANWRSVARLAVVSSFAGGAEFLSQEFLNLADRRPLAYRTINLTEAPGMDLSAYRAIVYIEPEPPGATLRSSMMAFVAAGGILLSQHSFVTGSPKETRQNHRLFSHGKGIVAVPETEWSDPWQLAQDAHLLLGREHDVIRLYNAASFNVSYTASGDGKRAAVQLLNFALRAPAHQVTVSIGKNYGRATICSLDRPEPEPVRIERTRFGIEIPLPGFEVYCAIELES